MWVYQEKPPKPILHPLNCEIIGPDSQPMQYLKILIALLLALATSFGAQAKEINAQCKLTVNSGLQMSGDCTYDRVTGKFSDHKLKTACRSGESECSEDEREVIRGGTFGKVTQEMGGWTLCWNEGGNMKATSCFEEAKKERDCWLAHEGSTFLVLCISK
jgi:hypothetical protein